MIPSGAPAGAGAAPVVTTTDVLHDAVNCVASTTVHVVGVVPTGNSDPGAGEQVAVSGGVPPPPLGAKLTATGFPSGDTAAGEGQSM